MNVNLSKQTKYYRNIYNSDKGKFELEEIQLKRENWWYVQLDATIRTAFLTHNCPIPKYVIIEESSHYTSIYIFRETINNIEELAEWYEKSIYIFDELKRQAEANSDDNDDKCCIRYEFKLM